MPEAHRLITSFKHEADRFHATTLSLEYLHIDHPPPARRYARPNHTLPLWQYYGEVSHNESVEELMTNLQNRSEIVGLPGSKLSCFGVIEHAETDRFVRMGIRAGSLFSEDDASDIRQRLVDDFLSNQPPDKSQTPGKQILATNSNPLAVWLNYLLYYLSVTKPGAEKQHRIYPDPFALSLIALEQLVESREIGKLDPSATTAARATYSVAMSFSGRHRDYVSQVASVLKEALGAGKVFFDEDRQSLLARPNLDLVLQGVFRKQARLCVVFVSSCYLEKEWCQIEWRAMRDLLKAEHSDRLFIVRFDDSPLDGFLGIDGYVDARSSTPAQVAEGILSRLNTLD